MQILKAGPFTLLYDKGFLRHFKYGESEILRMIYFAFRDENWFTPEGMIEQESIQSTKDGFTIQYHMTVEKDSQPIIRWVNHISGKADGSVSFEITGTALKTFKRNRAGFCILHPIDGTANEPVEITHDDGSISQAAFPEYIAPINPFKNIQQIRWRMMDRWYKLQFEGDAFETEDQRNWSDASFKTFCTPLSKPFPVTVNEGDVIHQRVLFSPEQNHPALSVVEKVPVHITMTDQSFQLPAMGIGSSSESSALLPETVSQLGLLKLSHYRVDVHPYTKTWIADFSLVCEHASQLHLPLEVAIHLTDNFATEIEAFINLSEQNRLKIKFILLLGAASPSTPQPIIDFMSRQADWSKKNKWGAGTDNNFTQLNRNRFEKGNASFVSCAVHPQEHAFDDVTLIENTAAQAHTIASAKHIYPDVAVHVSILTLKKRSNPSATDPSKKIIKNQLRQDPRQKTAFGAVWTLGSLKNLMDADSVTLFQTQGDQGIISGEGVAFPIYKVLKEVLAYGSGVKSISSQPLVADALIFQSGKWIVWNYTTQAVDVILPDGETTTLAPLEIKLMN